MTERGIHGLLQQVEGPVIVRPGFEEELLGVLAAELEERESASDDDGRRTPAHAGLGGGLLTRLPRPRTDRHWLLAAGAAAVAATLFVATTAVTDRAGRAPTGGGIAAAGEDGPADVCVDGWATYLTGSGSQPSGAPRDEGAIVAGGAEAARGPGLRSAERDYDGGLAPREDDNGAPIAAGPDEDLLAFASKPGDYWHIYTMRADGTQRRQLTDARAHDREPDWSPDGSKIVFYRIPKEGDHYGEIFVMDADGSNERSLGEGAEPQFSPDGRRILFTGSPPVANVPGQAGTLWIMDVDGSNRREIYSGEGFVADATWSPVGGLIAFAGIGVDGATARDVSQTTNLFTMTGSGERVRRLTNTLYACNSEFSPGGSQLAFISSDGGPFVVWTMNVDGSEKSRITEGPGTYAFPHWSPNGARIAFGFDPDGEPHWSIVPESAGPRPSTLWSIRPDGTGLVRISPDGANDSDPAFAPRPN